MTYKLFYNGFIMIIPPLPPALCLNSDCATVPDTGHRIKVTLRNNC